MKREGRSSSFSKYWPYSKFTFVFNVSLVIFSPKDKCLKLGAKAVWLKFWKAVKRHFLHCYKVKMVQGRLLNKIWSDWSFKMCPVRKILKYTKHNAVYSPHTLWWRKLVIWSWIHLNSKYVKFINMQKESSCPGRVEGSVVQNSSNSGLLVSIPVVRRG